MEIQVEHQRGADEFPIADVPGHLCLLKNIHPVVPLQNLSPALSIYKTGEICNLCISHDRQGPALGGTGYLTGWQRPSEPLVSGLRVQVGSGWRGPERFHGLMAVVGSSLG